MRPSAYWWFTLGWTAAAAVLVDLGTVHRHHNADSLVPVLSSLYAWTFYYWEQNRYGMLVALVASPVRDPVANLLVQNGLTIWLGLLCFPLAARLLTGGVHPAWLAPAAAAGFLALAPDQFQWMFLSTFNVFSTSLALGLAGLIALDRLTPGRAVLAAAAGLLATWTNASVGVMLFPLVVAVAAARRLTRPAEGDPGAAGWVAAGQAAWCLALVAAAKVLERVPPPEYRTTWVFVPPPAEWPGLVAATAGSFWADQQPIAWAVVACGCAAVGAAVALRRKDWRGPAGFVAVVAAAAAFACLTGVLFKGRWRYSVPGLVLLHVAAAALLARGVPRLSPRGGAVAVAAAVLAVVAAAVTRHGPPDVANATAGLAERYGPLADDVRAAGATHLAGDYWEVWPAVFLANSRDPADPVWGLAGRSGPTAHRWKAVPPARVRAAVIDGDGGATPQLAALGLKLAERERRGRLIVYAAE